MSHSTVWFYDVGKLIAILALIGSAFYFYNSHQAQLKEERERAEREEIARREAANEEYARQVAEAQKLKMAELENERLRLETQAKRDALLAEQQKQHLEAQRQDELRRREAERKAAEEEEQRREEKRRIQEVVKVFVCPRCQDTGKLESADAFKEIQRAEYECKNRNKAEIDERERFKEDAYRVFLISQPEIGKTLKDKLNAKVPPGALGAWAPYQRKDGTYGLKRSAGDAHDRYCTCALAQREALADYKLKERDVAELEPKRQEARSKWIRTCNQLTAENRKIFEYEKERNRVRDEAARFGYEGAIIRGDSKNEQLKAIVKLNEAKEQIERLNVLLLDALSEWLDLETDYVVRRQLVDKAKKAVRDTGAQVRPADPAIKGAARYTILLKDTSRIDAKMYGKVEQKLILQLEDGTQNTVPLSEVVEIIDNLKDKK